MTEYLVPLAIIGLLILLNGLFVAAEFAIVAVPRTRVAQAMEAGSRTASYVLAILNDAKRQNLYLATAQIGITIASLGLGMYGEHVVAEWLLHPLERLSGLAGQSEALAHTIATVLAIGLLTYLHVVLGEMVPKSLAIQHAESTVLRIAPPMRLIQKLIWPIVALLNGIGNGIVRLMGIPPADVQTRLFSPQELEFLVEESTEGGMIEPEEQLFIENIFDLRERSVSQVMTPRNQISGIAITANEARVLTHVCEGHHSRYPVYDEDLDEVVGILHAKTLARQQARRSTQPFDLQPLLRPALYVPESLSLEKMLARFRRERSQIAIVVDEFGGTAGLVTLEDVIEEVVGEILDEFDEEQPPLEEIEPTLIRVRGNLLVDEINQLYDLDLEHPEADTVGGLVMSLLGRVAQAGDVVASQDVTFEVESVRGLAVQTVLVRLAPETPQGE
jgi:CBS domain containing-hemolysin-like protein